MSDRIRTYLAKRASLDRHTLECPKPPASLRTVIVIPAIGEESTLPETRESLTHCNPDLLSQTLIMVVVNNRSPEVIDSEIFEENRRTLTWLRSSPYPEIHLAMIDASSPGFELSKKEGVGSARKIGMDHAANLLLRSSSEAPLIVCLDADTLVQPNYLDALHAFAVSENPWAAVINYAHTIPEDPTEQAAIVSYELFLRYQELGLRHADSPYAFHTIGSTIACTPEAYAAVSGMNRRKAGEDFYFLQQLKKTGSVTRIKNTTVHPSPRNSWRVPFGTGKRIGRFLDNTRDEYLVYHPDIYAILKDWFQLVADNLETTGDKLAEKAGKIHPELRDFLHQLQFSAKWTKMKSNAASPDQLNTQFHCFFDAFQTLKLTHRLRDTALPDQNTFEAFRILLPRLGIDLAIPYTIQDSLPDQLRFLESLRETMTG